MCWPHDVDASRLSSAVREVEREETREKNVKPGVRSVNWARTNPEAALRVQSETRFQCSGGTYFEFQRDGQGAMTGAILAQQGPQGPQRLPLVRK
jgi:hypothetical protein